MTQPLPVSVVIPAYNRAAVLPRALASVHAQTQEPAELIVVDDASIDDTGEVAAAADARLIQHDRNRGECAARNTGVDSATQPWIAFLDSDDEWTPRHLERLFAIRDGHVLVATAALRIGLQPGKVRFHGIEGRTPKVLASPADVVYPVNPAPLSGVMILRKAIVNAGWFDPTLRLCGDLDLCIRVLETGSGIASPTIGCIYHDQEDQVSRDRAAMDRAYNFVVSRYRDRSWLGDSLFRRTEGAAQWSAAVRAVKERRVGDSVRAIFRVISHPDCLWGAMRIQVFWLVMRWRTHRAP